MLGPAARPVDALHSPELLWTAKAVDHKEDQMPLLETEAFRFAEVLEDYEHVSVTDIGGTEERGFWVVVRDRRFDAEYGIASHCNYWDFVGAVVDHRQYIAPKLQRRVA